ncbi:Xicl protein [Xenopus laevis]|uniref:XICL n=1 Tax=Xenopus laevis TaxID=8355 RepID=Q91603_XENLA|nr:Xicl protein [Xenopus laevis]AAC59725.1 XICL [Xenopus laevis]AAI69441.1 Xicl gene [Xenopus laevis]AAI69443.1 Xicl gene [Xenopus laevis]prf//2123436A cyclin-dependent kinase inhibitor Xic-1 [Xenopus laevis]
MAAFHIALQEEMIVASPAALPRLSLGTGRGACRNLFGPIDHDELRSELKRQLKEIQASDCQRWNFDFESGTPLKGTFCWEPVETKDVPSFYSPSRSLAANTTPQSRQQQPLLVSRQPEPREEAPVDTVRNVPNPPCAKENAEKIIKRCQGVKGPTKASANTSTQRRKREITTPITDYFPKRKKILSAKPDATKGVHLLCPLEQTPRKKIR